MYLETLKNIAKDKKKEKLIYILVLCVVLLIAITYIFSGDKKEEVKSEKTDESKVETTTKKSDIETKLANILSQISGVSEVSVMVTYSEDSKVAPVYNVKEETKDNSKIVDKQVVFNEESSKKSVAIESTSLPKVEGVIVVAKGINSIELKSRISTAVSTVTGIGVYKVQVFEKE